MRDRDAKQQALIVAALKLFASKGYDATTTREIATCAGCAEGLIHRYFRSKAGLLSALIGHRISQEVADLAHHVRPAQSLKDEYLQLVDWAVEHMWADREFLRVALPRAVLDPSFGRALRRVGPQQKARAIAQRLKKIQRVQSAASCGTGCNDPTYNRAGIYVRFYASGRSPAGPQECRHQRIHAGQAGRAQPSFVRD